MTKRALAVTKRPGRGMNSSSYGYLAMKREDTRLLAFQSKHNFIIKLGFL